MIHRLTCMQLACVAMFAVRLVYVEDLSHVYLV